MIDPTNAHPGTQVEACKRQEKHARGSCPYAHPGDVAQRRHPDSYQALLCPEVRAVRAELGCWTVWQQQQQVA